MKRLLVSLLLIGGVSRSLAEKEFQILDPRPLANISALGIDEGYLPLLKSIPDLLKYDKKSLKEVIGILESYYAEDFTDKIEVKKINVNYAALTRIGDAGDNFYKDGTFVYYCSSTLYFDTEDQEDKVINNTVLVTLDGKIIPNFTQVEAKK
ncbi:MAG: hypothetical protein ACSHX7_14160 [Luteolibacter sp.]